LKSKWHSILVNTANPEGGAKNPSKGISMKFFVSARDAQSRVVAGSKERWGDLQWHAGVDPTFVETYLIG